MDTLFSVLIWGGLFFLMMRFGCGSHMFGRGQARAAIKALPPKAAGGAEAAAASGGERPSRWNA